MFKSPLILNTPRLPPGINSIHGFNQIQKFHQGQKTIGAKRQLGQLDGLDMSAIGDFAHNQQNNPFNFRFQIFKMLEDVVMGKVHLDFELLARDIVIHQGQY